MAAVGKNSPTVRRWPRRDSAKGMVGLNLNQPDKALVRCVDEKSQIRPRSYSVPSAHEKGARRHHDPRLQAQRRHNLLHGTQHAGRQGKVIGKRCACIWSLTTYHRVGREIDATMKPSFKLGTISDADHRSTFWSCWPCPIDCSDVVNATT